MKKAGTIILFLLSTTVILIISCSKASEDKLSTPTPGSGTGCDTVNMTYSADVVPILQANCYSCHGNGGNSGGVNLDTYENVKAEAADGSLLGTITHASGYAAMPLGGSQLSDCDINTIKDWINNGMLNN